jgi:hypothetical protein
MSMHLSGTGSGASEEDKVSVLTKYSFKERDKCIKR